MLNHCSRSVVVCVPTSLLSTADPQICVNLGRLLTRNQKALRANATWNQSVWRLAKLEKQCSDCVDVLVRKIKMEKWWKWMLDGSTNSIFEPGNLSWLVPLFWPIPYTVVCYRLVGASLSQGGHHKTNEFDRYCNSIPTPFLSTATRCEYPNNDTCEKESNTYQSDCAKFTSMKRDKTLLTTLTHVPTHINLLPSMYINLGEKTPSLHWILWRFHAA